MQEALLEMNSTYLHVSTMTGTENQVRHTCGGCAALLNLQWRVISPFSKAYYCAERRENQDEQDFDTVSEQPSDVLSSKLLTFVLMSLMCTFCEDGVEGSERLICCDGLCMQCYI